MPTISRLDQAPPRPKSTTRGIALLFAIGALFAIGVVSSTQAALPSPPAITLDGDAIGSNDWTSGVSGVLTYTDGTGANDDIFWMGGSKDVRPIGDWAWKTGPTPSQKTDLQTVWVKIDGNTAYFAARRASSVGNAKIGFWFLKNGVSLTYDDPPTTGRFDGEHAQGDVLIEVDWTTGAVKKSGLRAYTWDAMETRNGPKRLTEHLLDANRYGDCQTVTLGSVDVCATVGMNGTFIEGAISLTAFGFDFSNPCRSGILAETRASGSSVMSSLEDFVGGSIATCSLTVRKVATDEVTSFTFTTTGLTEGTFNLSSGGSRRFNLRDNSTYTVTESAKDGWTLTNLACTRISGNGTVATSGDTATVTLGSGQTGVFDCTFTNRRNPTVTLQKQVVPDSSTAQFALNLDGNALTTTATDGTSVGPVSVAAGIHSVSETDGSGIADLSTYSTAIGCRKGEAADYTTVTGLRGVDRPLSLGSLAYGDRVTCVFTNTEVTTIKVTKYRYGGTTGETFKLFIDDYSTGAIGHLGSLELEVSNGTHTVREVTAGVSVAADYSSGISCRNGMDVTAATGTTLTFAVTTGDRWDCAITNIKKPKIILEKLSTGSTGAFTFDVSAGSSRIDLTTLTTTGAAPGPYSASKTYTFDGTGGTYTFAELTSFPDTFTLTDVTCATQIAGEGGTSFTAYLAQSKIVVSGLAAGAVIRCTFTNAGVFSTRTQGFWSTHQQLAHAVWSATSGDDDVWNYVPMRGKKPNLGLFRPISFRALTSGDGVSMFGTNFCGVDVTTGVMWKTANARGNDKNWPNGDSQLMGGFWSGISKTTTGGVRDSHDQARMQLLQQLLAAMLNYAFFGSQPGPGEISILEAQNRFCAGTTLQVQAAAAAMGLFNSRGDTSGLTPGGSADPRNARYVANREFWNTLPTRPTVQLDLEAATVGDSSSGTITGCTTCPRTFIGATSGDVAMTSSGLTIVLPWSDGTTYTVMTDLSPSYTVTTSAATHTVTYFFPFLPVYDDWYAYLGGSPFYITITTA